MTSSQARSPSGTHRADAGQGAGAAPDSGAPPAGRVPAALRGTARTRPRVPHGVRVAIGAALLVGGIAALWQVMSRLLDSPLTPSLGMVVDKTLTLLGENAVDATWVTVVRVLLGFTVAFLAAVVTGLLMARSMWARAVLEPAVVIGLTVPGLVWALLCVIWFGLSLTSPVTAVALSAAPVITLNVYHGAKSVDADLLEMAHVFKFGPLTRLRRMWLPALAPFLLAGARLGLSLAWKVIVVVEMFGASNGVGYELNNSFSSQDVAGVLAWTLIFCAVMFVIEYGLLRVIENRVTRWRKAATV